MLLVGSPTGHEGEVPVPLVHCLCGLPRHCLGTLVVRESMPIDSAVPQHTHPVAEIEESHWSVGRVMIHAIGQLSCKSNLWSTECKLNTM